MNKPQNIFIFLGLVFLISLPVEGKTGAFRSESGFYEDNFVLGEIVVLTDENNFGDEELLSAIFSLSPVAFHSIEKLHKENLKRSAAPHGKRLFILKFDKSIDPRFVAKSLKKNSFVLIAEPNFFGRGNLVPNDSLFITQWGLQNTGQFGGTPDADIDGPEAWDIEMGKQAIAITVIDTGADLDHEDLITKLLPGWDVIGDDFVPEDDQGHGTLSVGVAAAATNNGRGIAGTCPECMVLPVKAGYNSNGNPYFPWWAVMEALEYATGNPGNIEGVPENQNISKIISMSFSGSQSGILYQGVRDAWGTGAVLVAAAGNDNSSNAVYPAAYSEVIAVAATDDRDTKASFSNYGFWVDVAAPGVSIQTTYLENLYAGSSGTSLSTPFVAGTVGLIFSKRGNLSQEIIKQILIDTSEPVTGFPELRGGRINAVRALRAANPANSFFSKFMYEQY